MITRALLASTCLATMLTVGLSAQAQDEYGAANVREIDAVYYVTWLEATVREQPSSLSVALAEVRMGERIFVTGIVVGTEWVRVAFDDGTVGFMWNGVLAPAMVGGAGGSTADSGATQSGDPTDGAGNSIYDAREIGNADATDVSFDDFVGNNDLDDFYAIEVSDWTFIDLALEGLVADADLQLLDENQEIVGSSEAAGPGSEYVQQTIPAGRYYVRVTAYEGETAYTLYMYSEPTDPPPPDTIGDTMEGATMIDPPGDLAQIFDERLDISDRDDWYGFTLADFTEISASLYGLQADLDLEIVDQDGNSVAMSDNGTNTDENAVAVVGPGTHFVHVFIYAGQSDYTLEVSGVPATPPPPDGAGNSLDDALDLGALDADSPTGIDTTEWVGPGDLDDFFAFSVGAQTAVEVRLADIVGDLDLELLDSTGEIVSVSNNSGNASEMVGVTLEPGTYYLHVYAFDGNSDYALSIRPTATP